MQAFVKFARINKTTSCKRHTLVTLIKNIYKIRVPKIFIMSYLIISDIILGITTFFMLLFGTIEDFKKREVYDIISYTGIAIAVIVRLTYSLLTHDFHYVVYPLISLLFAIIFGVIMYYANQWGGGDVNILIALSLLLGTWPMYLTNSFAMKIISAIRSPHLVAFSFFMIFFFLSMIMGVFVGLGYGVYIAIKEAKRFNKEFLRVIRDYKIFLIILTGAELVLLAEYVFTDDVRFLLLLVGLLVLKVVTIFSITIEKLLIKKVKPTELTEGDWIIEDIYVDGKKIYSKEQPGVTLSQIRELRRLYKQKKIKEVTIKEGFPFIPAFFLGYLVTFIIFFF